MFRVSIFCFSRRYFHLSTCNASLAVQDTIHQESVKFPKVSRFSGIVSRIKKPSTNHKLDKRGGVDLMNRLVEGFCEGCTIHRDSGKSTRAFRQKRDLWMKQLVEKESLKWPHKSTKKNRDNAHRRSEKRVRNREDWSARISDWTCCWRCAPRGSVGSLPRDLRNVICSVW
jgi:hypothetical protein